MTATLHPQAHDAAVNAKQLNVATVSRELGPHAVKCLDHPRAEVVRVQVVE